MPRRILIAPDKFKGSLSAPQAASAIAAGILRVEPDAILDRCPIADGGEGFMDALAAALNGREETCAAVDALDRPITSRYILAETPEGPAAIIEMAETAGLWRLTADERNPIQATTKGVGMQMVDAISRHAVKRIILGIGGSATNDGGAGMAHALGIRFLDESGAPFAPVPANLKTLGSIEKDNRVTLPEIIAACDVENPLLGTQGATAIFSTQKGAGPEAKLVLEDTLSHLVRISSGEEASLIPGAGAAGGLGFGLMHFADAKLISGFDLLAGLLGLESRIKQADLVVTGEGSIDHQSLSGKGPVALARLANLHAVPVSGYCGASDEAARSSGIFRSLHALAETGLPVEVLMRDAGPLLEEMVASTWSAEN